MADKVLTANRLSDGISVWYDADGNWSESLQDAVVAHDKETADALEAKGKQAYAENRVVDVNVIDVEQVGGVLRPLRMRERIRAEGPSIEYAAGFAGLNATGPAAA